MQRGYSCWHPKRPLSNESFGQNGYAQVVHHVHFHIVPAPTADSPRRTSNAFSDHRSELDEEEGQAMASAISKALKELEEPPDTATVAAGQTSKM